MLQALCNKRGVSGFNTSLGIIPLRRSGKALTVNCAKRQHPRPVAAANWPDEPRKADHVIEDTAGKEGTS